MNPSIVNTLINISIVGLSLSLFLFSTFFIITVTPNVGKLTKQVIAIEISKNTGKSFKSSKLVKQPKVTREEFEMRAYRVGLDVTYAEYLVGEATLIPKLIVRIVLLSMGTIPAGIFLMSMLVSPALIMPIGMFFGLFMALTFSIMIISTPMTQIQEKEKKLKKGIKEELSRFLTNYIYAPKKGGLYKIITNYLDLAGPLKRDLEIFLTDCETLDENEALNLLSERVGIPEMNTMITAIKTISDSGDSSILINTLMDMERKFQENVNAMRKKELALAVNVSVGLAFLMLLVLTGVFISAAFFSGAMSFSL